MSTQPLNLLHLLGPYLPTDRFRAIVAGRELPVSSHGAVMLVDISGYTPLTAHMVEEFGPQQASEKLQQRLNPMYEAIAGQVFHKGGSVIRFLGDGFIAWFDEDYPHPPTNPIRSTARAVVAASEMMALMRLFKDLELRISVGYGQVMRWDIGAEEHGLVDLIVGPAINDVMQTAQLRREAGVVLSQAALAQLQQMSDIVVECLPDGGCRLKSVDGALLDAVRVYRWPAWEVSAPINAVMHQTSLFVPPTIENQIRRGYGTLVNELRYVTPVFVQFNGIDFDHDTQAKQKLNAYMRDVQEIIAETGGQLISVELSDKGSVIYIAYGAPLSYRNDSVRAVQASLKIQALTRRHTAISWQRIGISRGLLYTGTVGGEVRHEYTAIGASTNLAARLMVNAEPNQILVAGNVRAEAEEDFDWGGLSDITVKGYDYPVKVAEPMRRRYSTKVVRRFGSVVGRDSELEQFRGLLQAVQDSRPQIVRISGQNGVGKSHLAGEFLNIAMSHGFRVTRGNCMSLGSQIPFLPWRNIISDLLDLRPNWTDSERLEAIPAYLSAYHPNLVSRWVLFADLLGLDVSDDNDTLNYQGDRQLRAIEASVIDLLWEMIMERPLALLIEDTHWLDEVSENLLITIVKQLSLKPAPILIMIVHRSEEEVTHPPRLIKALQTQPRHTLFALKEINEKAVNEIIEERLGAEVPPELTRFIYQKTRGNTFFVRELVDHLRETNAVSTYGRSVFINQELETIKLPRTVLEMSQSRIDSLSEDEKMVLKVAAVIGGAFNENLLWRSLPVERSNEELSTMLDNLVRREFLQHDSSGDKYIFRHAIMQDVSYQSMLSGQRELLHQTVGLAIEELEANAYERLAYHFFNTPDRERARKYMLLAAYEAKEASATHSAVDYFNKALTLIQDEALAFKAIADKIRVLFRMGNLDGVMQALGDLRRIADRSDRVDWQAQVGSFQARLNYQQSIWQEAISEAERVLEYARHANDLHLMWHSYDVLRLTYQQLNDHSQASSITTNMQRVASQLNDPFRTMILLLEDLDSLHITAPEEAERGLANAYAEIKALKSFVAEGRYWQVMAGVHERRQQLPAALDAYQRQLSFWRKSGNQRLEGHTMNNIGHVLIQLGQMSEGNNYLQWAYRLLHQMGDAAGEARTLAVLGILADRYRAFDEAVAYLKRAIQLVENRRLQPELAKISFLLGNSLLNKDDHDGAEMYLEQATTIAAQRGAVETASEYRLGLAHLAMMDGDVDRADRLAEGAIRQMLNGVPYAWNDLSVAYWRLIGISCRLPDQIQAEKIFKYFQQFIEKTHSALDGPTSHSNLIENIPYYAHLIATEGRPRLNAPSQSTAE